MDAKGNIVDVYGVGPEQGSGWVGLNATLAWVQSPSTVSTGSFELTVTQPSWPEAWSPYPPNGSPTSPTPARAGEKFSGEATVAVTGSPGPTSVALAFFNSSGAALGLVIGQAVTPSPATWTTLPEVAGVAPSASVSVAVGVIEFTGTDDQRIYVDSPVLSTLGPGSPSVVGPLHTSGNKIIQANGQPVVLQGVVLDGLENSGTSTAVTYDSVLEAKAWGANFVRVPLGEQFWLSSNCDYVPSYEASVDEVVHWITSLGMVALLDLHTNTVGGCEAGGPHNMADEAQSPTFWSQVAGRYGNPGSPEYNPLVAFDLYNEPHNISDSIWLNGGETTDAFAPNQTYETAGMQQLYDSVRSAGSQNLVFISGNNWANNPPAQLVSGTNIVYAVHYYTCPNAAPPACTTPNPYDPAPGLQPWVSFSAGEPVVLTEFGWPSDADGTYLANVISFARGYNWGWSAFAWGQGPPYDFGLADWLSDGTAEPTPAGVPVLLALSSS